MRKRWLIGLGVCALTVASIFPFIKSDAARSPQPKGVPDVPVRAQRATLPNYDIRLEGRGEFTDYSLNSDAVTKSAVQSGSVAVQARASAVDNFRAKVSPENARNLRAEVNEAGAMKNFFIDGAPLSEARSDTADNTARHFLRGQAALFALSDAAVAGLKLHQDNNDTGT